MANSTHPDNYIYFGPKANCTLALCNPVDSIYAYQPSLAANTTLLALFALFFVIFAVQSCIYRTWGFLFATLAGCLCEVIGYAGRVMAHNDPFSFDSFLIQIILLAIGPAFLSAGIYITLTRIAIYLGPQYSRLGPKWYYWTFIPCDVLALTLQATGGALSSISIGKNKSGVSISVAGLIIQVVTLFIFICMCTDLALRFLKDQARKAPHERLPISTRFKVFTVFLSLAIVFIWIRCVYRIDELNDGYTGAIFQDEGLFIALEGAMIVAACICLIIAHPGPVFKPRNRSLSSSSPYPSNMPQDGVISPVDSETAQIKVEAGSK